MAINTQEHRPALDSVIEVGEPAPGYWTPPSYGEALYWSLADGVLAVKVWWRTMLLVSALAAAATALIAQFAMTKWYLATAIIRPSPPMTVESRMTGLLSALGSAGSIAGVSASSEAEEYIPILQSFDFAMGLVQQHHLAGELLPDADSQLSDLTTATRRQRWEVFNAIKKRFDYEFSLTTGNLVLYYEDPDPTTAERILGFFIEDLRDRLRRRQIQDAAAAINSLEAEIKVTGDVLLQSQLYELTAKQVQREKLAEVEADFAFSVLQSPAAPDKAAKPRVVLDSLLAGVMAILAFVAAVIFYESRRSFAGANHFELGTEAVVPQDAARLANENE